MRHIIFSILGIGVGVLVQGCAVGVMGGIIFGLCIAEITHMIDVMRG